jgi:hypothetical protein
MIDEDVSQVFMFQDSQFRRQSFEEIFVGYKYA